MKCEVYNVGKDGDVLVGTISFEDGQLSTEAAPGRERALANLMLFECFDEKTGEKFTVGDGPERWMRALPLCMRSTYSYFRITV